MSSLFSVAQFCTHFFRVIYTHHMFPFASLSVPPFFALPVLSFSLIHFDQVVMFCFLYLLLHLFPTSPTVIVLTFSGLTHIVAVKDYVFFVDLQYRVTKNFPKGGTVRPHEINWRDHPFPRSLKKNLPGTPATCEPSVTADLPTANCLCLELTTPQFLADISHTAV